MLGDVADKDPGWLDWLEEHDQDDPTLNEQEAYLRYQRFHKVDFGEAPKDM